METRDVILLGLLTILMVSDKLRDAISYNLIKLYDHLAHVKSKIRIPIGDSPEKFIVTCSGIALYVAKVRNLRKHPLTHETNMDFFLTLGLGTLLGLFVDIY